MAQTIYIEAGAAVRIWDVDDVATLTIGSWSLRAAGHNNYDANGRWTGYTFGEANGVFPGPTGVYTVSFVIENSLGGPGASGRWAAGTDIPGTEWVLTKSEDVITRYEEEHSRCEEVSLPTDFPASGGTKTARYIPWVWRTPVYRKKNTYENRQTGETKVEIEGDEELRESGKQEKPLAGVNVSLSVPANTTGAAITHTLYQCTHTPPCGCVITGVQAAEEEWTVAFTYRVPAGVKEKHFRCDVRVSPPVLTNAGGRVLVSYEKHGERVPLLKEYERQINVQTGAVRDVLLGVIEDAANKEPSFLAGLAYVIVDANETGADRTVAVWNCADCGAVASVLQSADGEPGIGDEDVDVSDEEPDGAPEHRCAGGVYYNGESCESAFYGAENIGDIEKPKGSGTHSIVL